MQHIETVTVGSGGAASITFSAIAAVWTDLYLLVSIRESRTDVGSAGGVSWTLRFNGVTTNQSQRDLRYNPSGSTPSSSADSLFYMLSCTGFDTANTFSSGGITIPNYAGSTNKSFSAENLGENNGNSGGRMSGGLWSSTDAITSISLHPSTGTFVQFSSASLYGITAGSDGIVAVS